MTKDLDIILFGATGFTGKHTIPVISKLAKTNDRNLKWGIAGRSQDKLQCVLQEYGKEIGPALSEIPIIIASIEDEQSLRTMAARTRIIINCCGPYHLYGEPVIQACLTEGTHHVDISAEPQFIAEMQLKYHQTAQEKGIYIICACGFGFVPIDLGVVYLEQNFDGKLNSIVAYLEVDDNGRCLPYKGINVGTWESAIYVVSNYGKLKDLLRQLYVKSIPEVAPKLKMKILPHKPSIVEGKAILYPAPDCFFTENSQRCFYETENKYPVQLQTYLIVKSWFQVFYLAFCALLFFITAQFRCGRYLLQKYPEQLSMNLIKNGPSKESTENTLFSYTLCGEGWGETVDSTPPNKKIVGRVRGRNPGYGTTCVIVVLSSIMVINETDQLPSNGGVYSSGAAFARTSLIKQLNENGVTFEILSQKDL